MRGTHVRSLLVSDVYPQRPASGAVLRMTEVARALGSVGTVDVVFTSALRSEVAEEDFGGRSEVLRIPPFSGVRARAEALLHGHSAAMLRHRRRTVAEALPAWAREPYDVVWFNRERTWLVFRELVFGRSVIDVDDFEDVLIRRWAALGRDMDGRPLTPVGRLRAWREVLWWRRVHARAAGVDVLVYASAPDRGRSRRSVVVPNTYPAAPPSGSGSETGRRPPTILFQGLFTWAPNEEAAVWLVEVVAPLVREYVPDLRVVLVGEASQRVRDLGRTEWVTVTGRVPDMAAHLDAADLVVVPLQVGSGTRIKILEAFAHGVPVVSTSVGAEGLDVVPGRDLVIADSAPDIARHCVGLLHDATARKRLAEAARATHAQRYLPEHARAAVHEAVRLALD